MSTACSDGAPHAGGPGARRADGPDGPAASAAPGASPAPSRSGFDACTAAPRAPRGRLAGLAVPCAVGIYFGGNKFRGCAQPGAHADGVTKSSGGPARHLVRSTSDAASCTTSNKKNLIDNTQAARRPGVPRRTGHQATALGLRRRAR
ncbi:hypothetical protein [Actinoplanes nipponensis]|uniref:hypothetical protein n=1 Tax=Actinoplanes nipponensis TaxID=135950 RepID=UPI0031E5FE7A